MSWMNRKDMVQNHLKTALLSTGWSERRGHATAVHPQLWQVQLWLQLAPQRLCSHPTWSGAHREGPGGCDVWRDAAVHPLLLPSHPHVPQRLWPCSQGNYKCVSFCQPICSHNLQKCTLSFCTPPPPNREETMFNCIIKKKKICWHFSSKSMACNILKHMNTTILIWNFRGDWHGKNPAWKWFCSSLVVFVCFWGGQGDCF